MAEKQLRVPLSRLRENPDNPRKSFGDMTSITESLDRQGMLQPIIAMEDEKGELVIVIGHRRFRAAKKLGWKEVDVIVRKYTRQEAFEAMISENSQREDVSPMEVARSYQKLMDDYGLTKDQAAERLSVGRTMFYTMVNLLKAAGPIQHALEQGKINTETARALAGVQGGERLQVQALNDALKLARKGEQPPSRAVIRMIQEKYSGKAKRGLTKHQRAAREHGEDVAVRRRVLGRILTRVCELVERRPHFSDEDLRMMALAHAETGGDSAREVFQRHGVRADRLSKVAGAQLRKLVIELTLSPWVSLDGEGEYSAGTKAIRVAYGLPTFSELEKSVEATANAEALFAKA